MLSDFVELFTLVKCMIFTLSNVMITCLKTVPTYPIFPSNFAIATSLNSKLTIRAATIETYNVCSEDIDRIR